MKKYIILLISIIIDGLIPSLTLYQFNNLTFFTPLCTVVSLIVLYDKKNYIKLTIITSLLYGGLYMSNILLSFIMFFTIIFIIKFIKGIIEDNFFTIILQILIVLFLYDGLFLIINSTLGIVTFNINDYFYKVSHSIIFNLLYGISIFYIYDY